MSKFNTTAVRPANTATGPIATKKNKTTSTHLGAEGFVRTKKSELFLLAVSNFVGQDTFHESEGDRDDRYQKLIREMAVKDPEWTAAMLKWLRGPEANMRSASLVGAAEYVKARLDKGLHGDNRRVINSVLQRADEPGELLAYWTSKYGRRIPQPVKRGVADAAVRLYNEKSLLKYDTDSHGFRFGDVIDLTHPTFDPGKPWQGDLFEYALDRRHNREGKPIPASLKIIGSNAEFKKLSPDVIDRLAQNGTLADFLAAAGMTWEQLGGFGAWNAARWEAMIPGMGLMAQIRNLRNFDEAGVSDAAAQLVIDRLTDPDEVAKSRQLPFRFLSAYEHAPSLRWGHALDKALGYSLRNIPELPGKTLILVDTSGSMQQSYNQRSTMAPVKAAAVFGVALGVKNGSNADIYGFATGAFRHEVKRGASTLTEINRFIHRVGEVGHGTDIAGAVSRQYKGHDRVIILSDMQTQTGGITRPIPDHVPVYGFNLQGYAPAAMRLGPGRHEFGGLTDATFKLIPMLEAAESGDWPWEV